MRRHRRSHAWVVAALSLSLAAPTVASAQIQWTDWLPPTPAGPAGTWFGKMLIGAQTVNVAYQGPAAAVHTGGGTNYWRDGSSAPFPAYDAVNAPTTDDHVQLIVSGTHRLMFDVPVFDLYMAIISMGQPGIELTYDFDTDFAVIDNGTGWWGPQTSFARTSATVLKAREGNGVLKFDGPVTALEFTTSPSENWHGFSIGAASTVSAVPEPGSVVLLGTGLAGLAGYGLRRRRRSA